MANGDNPFDLRRFGTIGSPAPQNPLMRAYRGVNFGPTMMGPQDIPRPDQQDDPLMSMIDRMRGGKATEAYRSHLADLPQQADYAPSKWRKLGAALTAGAASFGKQPQNAMALGEQVRDAPYRGALENWQLKGAGLKEQAGLEAADQTQQLARYKAILDYQDKDRDNTRLDKAQASTEAYQTARIEALKQQGWKQESGPNGELILINPNTHEVVNTGILTAKTTELGNDAKRLGYEGTRVGLEGKRVGLDRERVGLEGKRVGLEGQRIGLDKERVGLEGKRVEQTERGLGISQQNADTAAKNANTTATNSGYIAPGANEAAQTSAARAVVMQHPEFGQYLDDKGFIKLPGQYDAPWYKGGGTPPPDPTTDDNYRAFLSMVEAEKQRVLNTRRRP